MKAPFTRRRRPDRSKRRPVSLGKTTTAVVPPAQAIVERFQHILAEIERLPLPAGREGTELLDCARFASACIEKIFAKARDLLLKEPDAIPHWHCTKSTQRVLSKDAAKVFEALLRVDSALTFEEFLAACSTNLTAVRKLIAEHNPQLTVGEVEFELNRVLKDLISHDAIARLSRAKDKQIELSL